LWSLQAWAQKAAPLSSLEFHSSNNSLNESFRWAKQQALGYVRPGPDSIGPWYEAALPGRNAFCLRDVSHQALGAAALGLFEANRNMLDRFAESAAASRNWAAYWEIDGKGTLAVLLGSSTCRLRCLFLQDRLPIQHYRKGHGGVLRHRHTDEKTSAVSCDIAADRTRR
jgi:hypothetical protein